MIRFASATILTAALVTCAATAFAADPPKIDFTFPPTPVPSTTPSSAPPLEEIGRVRVTLCTNERKAAEQALSDTAHSDGVIVGVMKRIGETKFSVEDLMGTTAPGPAGNAATAPPARTLGQPQPPGSTPLPFVGVAQAASLPYWTGTNKMLNAAGDLEKSVRSAAAQVDRLTSMARTDPDPVRRAALDETIKSLTDAVVKQVNLIKQLDEFAIRVDAKLSLAEMQGVTNTTNAASGAFSPIIMNSTDISGLKIQLVRDSGSAHDAAVGAVRNAEEKNRTAFAACPR